MHVEELGPHVQEGHYDLIRPDGEIILPQVWEHIVEPGWAITMIMWAMPELKPQTIYPSSHPFYSNEEQRPGAGGRRAAFRDSPIPGPAPSSHRGSVRPPLPPSHGGPGPGGLPPRPPKARGVGLGGPLVPVAGPGSPPPESKRGPEPAKGVLSWMSGKPSSRSRAASGRK